MAKKTKKAASGQVRVDPQDQEDAKKLAETWKAEKMSKLTPALIFKAGIQHFQGQLQGA